MTGDGEVEVAVSVKNTGKVASDEVVQLYAQHLGSSVTRPQLELKGFKRVTLKPKETKTVQIPLKAESLAYWDEHEARWKVEDEPVLIMVGGSSAHVAAQRTIAVGR